MNKDELVKELSKTQKLLKEEKKNSDFLLSQVKEMKKLAEEAGSEMSKWKHECLRLQEEISKLESELKTNTGGSK